MFGLSNITVRSCPSRSEGVAALRKKTSLVQRMSLELSDEALHSRWTSIIGFFDLVITRTNTCTQQLDYINAQFKHHEPEDRASPANKPFDDDTSAC